ncbi:MAG TPA: ATP-dependent helicase [Candidatus Poseidoniia archaeon]|nr:ATP-dependent helicase [Candidatus Poseidoniia archaeon]
MVKYVKARKSKADVLAEFEPLISEWFDDRFDDLTPPQAMAVPLIHAGKNVLVSSPTGSGKTLTAFLSILNDLFRRAGAGRLEDGVQALYISPLKALANDIDRNLKQPLAEMEALAAKRGWEFPTVKVAVRSGDTSTSDRAKMVRKPPHILITTPESLGLLLSSKKFREHLRSVRYVILDEIHDLANNKRGTHLSLSVECLAHLLDHDPVRIGLSATQAPIEEIAHFLGGWSRGKPRPVNIVDVKERKHLDLRVLCPVDDLTQHSTEVVNSRMYDLLAELVVAHRTTLIFTNTRAGTESVVLQLQERGIDKLAAHHGSMSKEMRLYVEQKLKDGKMDAVVTSTSLELGIDIGYVDLVVQIGSPKSIAKGLQRIGRAGHALHQVSKGRLVVFDPDDLVECAVLVNSAYAGEIDRVAIPQHPADVLAQCIIGMSLNQRWTPEELLDVIRGAHPYRDFTSSELEALLEFLGGESLSEHGVYPKIWYNGSEVGIKRAARQIYNMNIGTIPQEINYSVVLEGSGAHIGNLSEKFVENLSRNDIFVLGGRTYQFLGAEGPQVIVKDGLGRKPTVPSWSGEMLPRSFDLSEAVGRFRAAVGKRLDEQESDTLAWLEDEFRVDPGAARTILSHLREQQKLCNFVPSDRQLLVEGYIDNRGRRGAVFHFPFGRRVNDALARAFAYELSRELEASVRISLSDDAFLLTFPDFVELEGIGEMLDPDDLEATLRRAIRNTEIFAQRFRHCANRSFMVLRNYKGREISLPRQQLRTSQVLEAIHELPNFPMLDEAYREVLHDAFDLKHAREVLTDIASGERSVSYRPYSAVPSPLAHGVILSGMSDIVLMEDRSALLRELHTQVLGRVLEQEGGDKARFEHELVDGYFNEKAPLVDSPEGVLQAIRETGGLALLADRRRSVYRLSELPTSELRETCETLIKEGHVESVWTGDSEPLFTLPEFIPYFRAVYGRSEQLSKPAQKALVSLEAGRKVRARKPLEELEQHYLLTRLPDGMRLRKPTPTASYEKALDWLVSTYLGYCGPRSAEQLAIELRLPEQVVEQTLYDLEERGALQGGNFVLGRPIPHYLLAEDIIYLEAQSRGDLIVISEKQLRSYVDAKLFRRFTNLQGLFDALGDVPSARIAYYRLDEPSLDEWWQWRDSDALLQGRFAGGRLRYTPANKVGIYQALYRRPPTGKLAEAIVELLARNSPLTRHEIATRLEKEPEQVEPVLRGLEECLQLHRFNRHRNPWTTHNRYRLLEEFDTPEKPERKMLLQVLRSLGPLSFAPLRRETWLPLVVLRSLLSQLQEEGIVTRIVVASATRLFVYVLSDELEALQTPIEGTPVRVLSWRDPMLVHMRREVFSRYGDEWTHPITRGGMLVGFLEMWAMSGLLEVRKLSLEQPELLPEVLAALHEHAGYQREFNSDVIRIKQIEGRPVSELEQHARDMFLSAGYQPLRDWLVNGPIVTEQFNPRELDGYLLWRQHIHPQRRFTNARQAFRETGGLRSEYELSLRIQGRFFHPRDYGEEFDLVLGVMIPGYATYCSVQDAMVYRDARDVPIEPEDRRLLSLAVDSRGVPRDELLRRSGLDPDTFKKMLSRLYHSLHMVRTPRGYYRTLPVQRILNRDEARFRVVKRLILQFGVVSAERLGLLVKGEVPMAELRAILAQLEREGVLIKGFLQEGDATLMWLLKEDLQRVRGHVFQGSFVLHQADRLAHYFATEIRQEFGLGACYVIYSGTQRTGAFKMSRRSKDAIITRFIGNLHERHVIEAWARQWRLNLEWDLELEESQPLLANDSDSKRGEHSPAPAEA